MTSLNEIIGKFNIFYQKPIDAIGEITSINTDLISKKTSISTLANSMFNYFKISISDLKKQNILVKTVRLQENLKPKESMSFEQVHFHEVIDEQWESSYLKSKFTNTRFLFVVFQEFNNTLYFRGLYSWKMPEDIIENELQHFWNLLHMKLKNGVTLNKVARGTKTITTNDLPSTKDSKIMHIRPKAQNASDVIPLPDGQVITKQAYWINASYISEILASMAPLQVSKEEQKGTQPYYYGSFKHLLKEDIYTINQFINIAQKVNHEFNQFHVNEEALNSIGYKISPPYTVSTLFENAQEYFNQKIFNDRYFQLPEDPVWQTDFISRTLENLENDYSIFKIDDTTYLTENALANAQIEKQTIKAYKTAVENFVNGNQFFTLASLRNDGFVHPIEDFGFDALFYESILKRPGHLQYLKLRGHQIFIKSPSKPSYDQFFNLFFNNHDQLELDELLEKLFEKFSLNLTFSELEQFFKSVELRELFYSPELIILFKNKEIYLDHIY